MLHIFCIVEGHGEERAYPALLRNYFNDYRQRFDIKIYNPYRLPKDKFQKQEVISEVVQYARRKLLSFVGEADSGLILISRDSDGECPLELRKDIESKIAIIEGGIEASVVICDREFEAWFLAASQSFVGHPDCVAAIPQFPNADSIQDAKGVFERKVLKEDRYYSETVDQPKFAAQIDFHANPEAQSRSLRRLAGVLAVA
jgi:hypothetical protein